jgi:hypothetical protein
MSDNRGIEQRLARLEAEVSELRQRLDRLVPQRPGWEQSAGLMKDNPAFEEVVCLGREFRESQQDPE